jgi:hypothetical protein
VHALRTSARRPLLDDDSMNASNRGPPGFPITTENRMNRFTLGSCAVAAGLLCTVGANASDKSPKIVQFSGAIGSQPFASGAGGAVVPNDVLGIGPGGRPWELRKLRASVDQQGVLHAKGKGLLLGGGPSVGLPAIPRNIQATLICLEGTTRLAWNSVAAPLNAQGDFSINAPLKPVAPNQLLVPPSPCNSAILLIRNSTAATAPGADPVPGPWFAAGIQSDGDDD